PLVQRCLWHFLDYGSRPDYCAEFCVPSFGRKKRRPPAPRSVAERVAAGEPPPLHYHKDLLRFEDAIAPAEYDYHPERELIRDKGDVYGGEAKHAYGMADKIDVVIVDESGAN